MKEQTLAKVVRVALPVQFLLTLAAMILCLNACYFMVFILAIVVSVVSALIAIACVMLLVEHYFQNKALNQKTAVYWCAIATFYAVCLVMCCMIGQGILLL